MVSSGSRVKSSEYKVSTMASCMPKKTSCPPGKYFTTSPDSTSDSTCTAGNESQVEIGTEVEVKKFVIHGRHGDRGYAGKTMLVDAHLSAKMLQIG